MLMLIGKRIFSIPTSGPDMHLRKGDRRFSSSNTFEKAETFVGDLFIIIIIV